MASSLVVASGFVVASGLAPRWAAKQPQNQAIQYAWINAVALLGLLRSPTRGKPARHNKPARHRLRSPQVTLATEVPVALSAATHIGFAVLLESVSPLAPISFYWHCLRNW